MNQHNTKKKKQHFIPKLYLRNFSIRGNRKQIGIFNTQSEQFISQGTLESQAYIRFYYGKDGKLEDLLCLQEGEVTPIIESVITNKNLPSLNSTDYYKLLLFTILLTSRNPRVAQNIITSRNELINTINEIHPETTENVDVKLSHIPLEVAIHMPFNHIADIVTACKDLHCKLLVNKTNTPFITCDNPVVKYNQYLEQRNWFGFWGGYLTIGLQIFLPINPVMTIVIYDSWTYKVGSKNENVIEIFDSEEINQLNLLQVLNCDSNIFFNENVTENYIRYLFAKSKNYTKSNQSVVKIEKEIKISSKAELEEMGEIVSLSSTNSKINLHLCKFKLTRNAKKRIFDNKYIQVRPTASRS